jgi:hypothetical protein
MQEMLLWWRPEFAHTLIAIQFTPAGIDGDESHAHVLRNRTTSAINSDPLVSSREGANAHLPA